MSNRRSMLLMIFAVASLITLTACVKSAEPREVPTGAVPDPTTTPSPVTFPDDELDHEARLEWWYHSGHLVSESGREFGFHFVLFKADDELSEPNLVAQLGIFAVETGEHYEFARAEAGIRKSASEPMTIGIADWIYGLLPVEGGHYFAAKSGDTGLGLDLKAVTPVMLHNEIGWLPTELGSTYYYSWPRQEAVGELVLNGESFKVTGTGWFDHQWGDFFVLGNPAGWQWFAVQLDDGGSLMITQARGIDGKIAETYGTYMSPDGNVRDLREQSDGINLGVLSEWTSTESGGTYPSGWSLSIESLSMELTINPVADDQEVKGGLPAASTYWEGKSHVSGRQNGTAIAGDAYVELSGYADPEPVEWMQRR